MTRLLAAAFIAALALTGVALATSTGITPAQIQAALVSPSTIFYNATQFGGTDYGYHHRAGDITNPTCRGLGKPAKGAYLVFSCTASSWGTMWVRPYSSTVLCETAISVGACPPPPPVHPLAGDPRLCGATFAYAHCLFNAAEHAAITKLRAENLMGVNYGCKATTAFVYKCTGSNPATDLTVSFVAGKTTWSTKVT